MGRQLQLNWKKTSSNQASHRIRIYNQHHTQGKGWTITIKKERNQVQNRSATASARKLKSTPHTRWANHMQDVDNPHKNRKKTRSKQISRRIHI